MKKDDNTIILLGAAVAAYFLFFKKKSKGKVIVDDSKHLEFGKKINRTAIRERINELKLNPIVNKEEYFKTRYKESLNACSY